MPRIPVGTTIESALEWLTEHIGAAFDVISEILLFWVSLVYTVLAAPPPLLLTALVAALAAVTARSVALTVFTVLAFLLIESMQLWTATLETLAVVIVAAAIAVLLGVPVGILAARSAQVSVVVRPVLDFMQTLPVFVYLVPAVFFFGIGVVPGIVATTVFAIPPAVRMTELGIRQVDGEITEAAHAFGTRPWQVLREVQFPLAVPSIMAGINQVIMLALSMVVVAGFVGAEGLGGVVVNGVTQFEIGTAFEGGIAVVILAIYLDRVTSRLGRRRRGTRSTWAWLRGRALPRALLARRDHEPVHASA